MVEKEEQKINTGEEKKEKEVNKRSSIVDKLSEAEAIIKRAEEIKRDSIKLRFLEDILKAIKEINEKLTKLVENTDTSSRKDFY